MIAGVKGQRRTYHAFDQKLRQKVCDFVSFSAFVSELFYAN